MRSSQSAGRVCLVVGVLGSLSLPAGAQTVDATGGMVGQADTSAGYTAAYNYAPNFYTSASQTQQQGTQSRAARFGKTGPTQAAAPQPNYYTNVTYSPVVTASAADMYTQQAQTNAPAQQWNSSYAAQQQQATTAGKKSFVSRVFSRSNQQSDGTATASTGNVFQRGVASWYGRDWHGKKTANGERYNMDSMTAAHKSLPFGTMVKVKNETNGRECVVRINNRGPFSKGRVIDLSRAAAGQLGMAGRGICRVSMEVLGKH